MIVIGVLLYTLLIVIDHAKTKPPPGEVLKFVAKDWRVNIPIPNPPKLKYANKGASLALNCTTNDPDAEVFLFKRPGDNDPYVDAIPGFKDRLKRVDQVFVVLELKLQDSHIYRCMAKNDDSDINMVIGSLTVKDSHSNVQPELFPSKDVVELEEGRRQILTCKTNPGKGTEQESYLNWYRDVSGTLQLIDDSRTKRTEEVKADGTFIDIEVLVFPSFNDTDIGTYVCQRTVGANPPTQASIQVKKSSNAAPSVTFPLVNTNIKYIPIGQLFTVDCEIVGIPKPKKFWRKDGKVVQDCLNIENPICILQLLNVNHESHSGVYECFGTNLAGNASKSLDIQVKVSPELQKTEKTFVANNDDDYELYCVVTKGNPNPTIEWLYQEDSCVNQKDCKPLEDDWKPFQKQIPDMTTPTNFSYIVSEATTTNFFFKCIVKNMEGNDTHTFKLLRQAFALPQFSLSPNAEDGKYTLNEQEELVISCSSDVYVYSEVVLRKDGKDLASETTIKKTLRQTNYTVKSVSLTDQGKYECVATLKRGGLKTEEVNVIVTKLEAPVIKDFDNRRVSQADKNKLITCTVEGNPPPSVSWMFNGKTLENNPKIKDLQRCDISTRGIFLTDKENELAICDMYYKEHNGTFECIATNKVSTSTKKMEFIIEAKPSIPIWDSEVIVEIAATQEISCEVEANPPANVTWTRLDSVNNNNSLYLSSSMQVDILILGNIQYEDGGLYVCTGTSALGKVEKVVVLKVKGGAGGIVGTTTGKAVTAVIVVAVLILVIALIAICWYRRHLKRRYALFLEPNEKFIMDPDRSLFDQSNDLPYDIAFEFPRERLTFLKTLGSGAFGEVWLCEAEGIHNFNPRDKSATAVKRRKSITRQRRRYHSISIRYRKQMDAAETTLEKTMVAVKTLKEDAAEDEYKDLASELKILIHLGEHKNIVNLKGACTMKGSLCVILECCPHGSLLTFLRSKRDIFQPIWAKHETDMENEFTYIDLLMIAFQITRGMDFLQSMKCIHRDLASRNVLVGEDYIMKIADFGLARDIYKDEFYLKQTTGLLPVKWMAPESLFDKVYTSMSDVWSFGIVLWEIFTLGGSPYPGLPTEDLFSFLEDGKRMDRPEICPVEVYEIMMDCWKKSPYERPLFAHIGEQLSNVMKQNVPNDNDYLDFTDNAAPNDDYLEPEQTNGLQKFDSNEYLEASATGGGNHYSSPKGQTYVPPPADGGYGDQLPPLPPTEGYVPMTPADHYKSPPFKFDDPNSVVV